jgi:hypothetical protein
MQDKWRSFKKHGSCKRGLTNILASETEEKDKIANNISQHNVLLTSHDNMNPEV